MPDDEEKTEDLAETEEDVDTEEESTSKKASTKTSSSQKTEDYEKRFKGLQRTFNTTQRQLEKLQEEKDTLLEETETAKQAEQSKQAEIEKLQKQLEDLQKEQAELSGKIATQDADLQRSKLILSDFPDLASFEAKGLLPSGANEEELKGRLSDFRTALTETVGNEVKKKLTNAAPPSSSGPSPEEPGMAEIYTRMSNLAGSFPGTKEREEYDKLAARLEELQSQEEET